MIYYFYSCKGTGFIPASYKPCPKCGGAGKGVLRDCRLCDDLCYVTEPWVPCNVCFGKGVRGNMGEILSPDCYNCRGVGYLKAGFGAGMPAYGTLGASPAPGMVPGYAPGIAPAYGPGYYPPQPPMGYAPTYMPPPAYF